MINLSTLPLLAAIGIAALSAAPDAAPEKTFLAENATAMSAMMTGMDIKPTGDVDRDFVAMMVPHHRGAVAMAQAELRYGKNPQLLRIAKEIVVGQKQEIIAMHRAIHGR